MQLPDLLEERGLVFYAGAGGGRGEGQRGCLLTVDILIRVVLLCQAVRVEVGEDGYGVFGV